MNNDTPTMDAQGISPTLPLSKCDQLDCFTPIIKGCFL